MRVKLIGNSSYNGKTYMVNKEYEVDYNTYINIKKNCIVTEKSIKTNFSLQTSNVKKILFIKYNGIGNIIMGTPTILKIKQLFDCEIDLLVEKGMGFVLEGMKEINGIYDDFETILKIDYDIVIVGIPGAIKESRLKQRFGDKVILLDHEHLKIYHEVEANINSLRCLGWDGSDIPDMYIPTKKVDIGYKMIIGITAGFGKTHEQWKNKNWGYENYANLIKKLIARYKTYKFVILGAAGENKILDYIKHKNIIDYTGKYTIHETAYIVSKCKFLVCNDTGLMHVAAAVKTPVYAIFGGTIQTKNYPWHVKSKVIQSTRSCVPCFYKTVWKECDNQQCMSDITPGHVFDAITKRVKIDISIVMPVSRYFLFQSTLHSISNVKKGALKYRFVFIDDNCKDTRIKDAIDDFADVNPDYDVSRLPNIVNYGKYYFAQTMKQGYNVSDSEYILFMPDDIIINPWLFLVMERSLNYFKDYSFITYFKDNRYNNKLYGSIGSIDYYDIVRHTDGVLSFCKRELLKDIVWQNKTQESGSCFWIEIKNQLNKQGSSDQLRYRESLAEHIGNVGSVMNPQIRNSQPLYAVDLNLYKKPEILEGL